MFAHDPWLSGLLGKQAYNWSGDAAGGPDGSLPADAGFVSARVPADATGQLVDMQSRGFRVISANARLTRPAMGMPEFPFMVRMAQPGDEQAVREIAASAFRYDRFHRDPLIPDSVADSIKQEWAGNYFAGKRGDWMLVADAKDGLAGFLQLLRGANGEIVIDLIAVHHACRGRGVAAAMIANASRLGHGEAAMMVVGTQIDNVASLALYQKLGFRVASVDYILHLHPTDQLA